MKRSEENCRKCPPEQKRMCDELNKKVSAIENDANLSAQEKRKAIEKMLKDEGVELVDPHKPRNVVVAEKLQRLDHNISVYHISVILGVLESKSVIPAEKVKEFFNELLAEMEKNGFKHVENELFKQQVYKREYIFQGLSVKELYGLLGSGYVSLEMRKAISYEFYVKQGEAIASYISEARKKAREEKKNPIQFTERNPN